MLSDYDLEVVRKLDYLARFGDSANIQLEAVRGLIQFMPDEDIARKLDYLARFGNSEQIKLLAVQGLTDNGSTESRQSVRMWLKID